MKTLSLYESLQVKVGYYAGEHLTPTLQYLDRGGNLVQKPLLEATLDEVAFAIQTLSVQSSDVHRRRNALEAIYTLAREHGFVGSETVNAIAGEVTK